MSTDSPTGNKPWTIECGCAFRTRAEAFRGSCYQSPVTDALRGAARAQLGSVLRSLAKFEGCDIADDGDCITISRPDESFKIVLNVAVVHA